MPEERKDMKDTGCPSCGGWSNFPWGPGRPPWGPGRPPWGPGRPWGPGPWGPGPWDRDGFGPGRPWGPKGRRW